MGEIRISRFKQLIKNSSRINDGSDLYLSVIKGLNEWLNKGLPGYLLGIGKGNIFGKDGCIICAFVKKPPPIPYHSERRLHLGIHFRHFRRFQCGEN